MVASRRAEVLKVLLSCVVDAMFTICLLGIHVGTGMCSWISRFEAQRRRPAW